MEAPAQNQAANGHSHDDPGHLTDVNIHSQAEAQVGHNSKENAFEDEFEDGKMPKFKISYPFLLGCCLTAALGSLLLGYDLGIISGAIVPIKEEFDLSGGEVEILTSSITLASILGSFVAGTVADKFGRKKGLLSAAVIFLIGSIGMASSPNFEALISWRFFTGIGVGMGLVICPMYCAELAPRHIRGSMTSFNEMFINVGIPLAFLVNLLLAGLPNDWRWMLLSGALPALGLFVTTIFLPESPRWLLRSGDREKAAAIVENLVHKDEPADLKTKVVKQTIVDMNHDFEGEKITWGDLLFRSDRRTLLIGMTFAFIQQVIGTDAILFYSVYTYEQYGITENTALLLTLVMGLIKLFTTILTSVIVDFPKVGRRKPLLIGGTICMIGLLIVSIAAAYGEGAGGLILGYMLYIAGFGLSYGPLCWLILAEIFSGPYRSKAISLGSVINRLTSFTITATYISLIDAMTVTGYYSMLTLFCFLSILFSYFFIPELVGERLGSRAPTGKPGNLREGSVVEDHGSVAEHEQPVGHSPQGDIKSRGRHGHSRINAVDDEEIGS